jgi:VanZ family protein
MNYTGNSFLILLTAPVNSVKMKYSKTIFWIFTAIIIVQAIAPINGVNSKLNNTYVFYFRLDYLVHVAMFTCLSILFRLAYFPEKNLVFSKVVFYFSVMFAAAICSEAIQWLVPYRVFNINDLIANIFGIVLSFPLIRQRNFFLKKQRKISAVRL